jgi:hypothetical protein
MKADTIVNIVIDEVTEEDVVKLEKERADAAKKEEEDKK